MAGIVELMQTAGHIHRILKDKSVPQQVSVFDSLFHLKRVVTGDFALTAKSDPVAEIVIGFELVGRGGVLEN